MKRPGWLGGGSDEQDAEAPEPGASGEVDGEKVSVPFGKQAPVNAKVRPTSKPKQKARAKPKAKAKAKPKVDDEAKTEPRRRLARRVREAEEEPAEDASQRSARRRRARASREQSVKGGKTRPRRLPAAREKAAEAGGAVRGTLKEGTEETRKRTRDAAPGMAAGLLKLLGAVFAVFFDLVGFVLNLLIGIGAVLAGPGRTLLRRLRRLLDGLSRQLTPARALALAVAGAAVLLALSQFADYRSITISTDAYAAVETVAPPPEIERAATGDPHSYAFVPVAVVALLLLAAALRGRWKLCRLIALGGFAAIAVGLLIDRPAGLDIGEAALKFDGAEGRLLGGFYAQVFAGLLLLLTSLLLARELRLQAVTGPARSPGPARSGQRLRLPRPRRGTEEARA
jgi:hypothetical protein